MPDVDGSEDSRLKPDIQRKSRLELSEDHVDDGGAVDVVSIPEIRKIPLHRRPISLNRRPCQSLHLRAE
jgi:hypothetical protein